MNQLLCETQQLFDVELQSLHFWYHLVGIRSLNLSSVLLWSMGSFYPLSQCVLVFSPSFVRCLYYSQSYCPIVQPSSLITN